MGVQSIEQKRVQFIPRMKTQLASNLTSKGQTATKDEGLESLVGKVGGIEVSNTTLKASETIQITVNKSYQLQMTSTVRVLNIPYQLNVKKSGTIRMKGSVTTSYGNTTGYLNILKNGISAGAITGIYNSSGIKTIDITVSKGDILTFTVTGQTDISSDVIAATLNSFGYDLTDNIQYLEGVNL